MRACRSRGRPPDVTTGGYPGSFGRLLIVHGADSPGGRRIGRMDGVFHWITVRLSDISGTRNQDPRLDRDPGAGKYATPGEGAVLAQSALASQRAPPRISGSDWLISAGRNWSATAG
ncbi:hypothetical protein PCANC_05074 [Puccinia coronata f. sp. avenae]|uniref:Uncharacterized protein n=1 Tax=Puccinia coronata f. sp. avenae TaxID=200324 RepID=A0A2N5T769_9BASI|nr:hypothetical protein PCANC_05074 [Puccinia coronata f. sp. avenae]